MKRKKKRMSAAKAKRMKLKDWPGLVLIRLCEHMPVEVVAYETWIEAVESATDLEIMFPDADIRLIKKGQ